MILKIILFFVTSFSALLVWADPPPACNNMKIFLIPTNYSTNTTSAVAFTARAQADTTTGGCSFFITIGYGSSSSYNTRAVKLGSDTWPYQIAKDAGATQIIKDFPDVSSCSDALCGTFATANGTSTKDNSYQFILDSSNQWRKYGSYSDNYTLRLYKGTPSSYTLVDQATMNVTFMAPKKADISIEDSGGSFAAADTTYTMNFGSMGTGSQKTADLILKYNAGCSLYASSSNNGSMKNILLSTQTVPYTFSMNGTVFSLAGSSGSPKNILTVSGVSPANGKINPLLVVVGNTTGKFPGIYSDSITFTVQSNE